MANAFSNPLEITDFSKGITDDVYLQDYSSASVIDNFFITSDSKLMTRPGSNIDVDTPADDQFPAGVQRVGAFINYNNNDALLVQGGTDIYYRNPTAYATFIGPTGNNVFSTGDFTSSMSFAQSNKHVYVTTDAWPRPMKLYKDSAGVFQLRTSGLPKLASDPVVTAGAVGTNDYLYAFHYEYTYTAGNQTFQDVGAVTEVALPNSGDPVTNPNSISAIPVISNGVTDNWDTTVIRVFIFRTIAGGNVFYQIGSVTNGTTVFSDNFSDASIQDNDPLYINDGTLDFDPVPVSKYVHVINSIGYYGAIKDGSEEFLTRVRQSVPGDPDSCPESFFVDLEDTITGISSVKSVPIILCKKHIYRIENNFDQFGRGGMNPVRISDTAGCVSNLSIVSCENGLFWAGNDGFYYSDGYQIFKISDGLNDTYKALLALQSQTNRIYGKFDEKERRIYWALTSDDTSLDNDSLIMLEIRLGIKEASSFTTWSGTSFKPTALEFFNGKLYRGDTRGYVFYHDDSITTDPKVDILSDAEDWDRETIIWTYESVNINFNGTYFRKVPIKALITAANIGNTTIQISFINDDGKLTRHLNVIRWRRNFVWGDPEFVWGNPDCVWNNVGLIEQWRRAPRNGLRLSYLKVVITNGFSPITNSDVKGTATFDSTLKTVTLDDAVTTDWPENCVDYYIATEADNYVKNYLISARNTADVITVSDTLNTLPPGSLKWVIRGFMKGEQLKLLSYNIFWNEISQSQSTYQAGQSGNNA